MHVFAENAAEGIISSLVVGFALFAMAWSFLRVLPPGKASLRFSVWFSALGGVVLFPLLQLLLRVTSPGGEVAGAGHGLVVLPRNWAAYLSGAWAVAASVGLIRVIAGARHLNRVRTASAILGSEALCPEVREIVLRARQGRAFELRVSDQMRVPVAIGFWRPAVVLPGYLLDELSPAQLSQVLLHETTHLLRYDDWTNLLQKIVRALVFFHPAVWWLEGRLTLEREMACDEAVVAETSDPRSYAECLALLAERSLLRRSLVLVQAAVSRLRDTSLRVKELLAPGPKKDARSWAAAAGVAGVLACSAVLGQGPDLVSFQSGTTLQAQSNPAMQRVAQAESGVRPQALPVLSKRRAKSVSGPRLNYSAKARAESPFGSHVLLAQLHLPAEQEPQVVLTRHTEEQPAPVLITTTMIVESDAGSGMPEQVWSMWRVIVYYPAPDKKAAVASHSI